MATWAWVCMAACAAALAGCQHDVYEVGMAVEGNQVVRSYSQHIEGSGAGTFVVDAVVRDSNEGSASRPGSAPSTRAVAATSRAGGGTGTRPSSDLAAIAGIYKVDPNTPLPWKGIFAGDMPNDVGNAGHVAHFATDMGSAWVYLERFRGDPDPASTLEERLRAADTLATVVAGWARARLGERKGFDKLGAFLDGHFHKDMRNFALLLWTAGAVRHMSTLQATEPNAPVENPYFLQSVPFILSSAQVDAGAIALQYLVERKYVDLEDAPAVVRYFRSAPDEQKAPIFKELWRKILTRRIGLTDKELIEHLVGIFDRGEEVSKSLESYIEGCKEYKEYLAKPRKQEPWDGPSELKLDEPSVPGFLRTLGATAFTPVGVNPLGADDELLLTLETKEAPILTNGAWDGNTGKVSWQRRFVRESQLKSVLDPLPAVCFAVWSREDEGFQKKHFGKTILRGRSLVEYCIWRRGLTAAEAKQWDTVMAAIRPETDFHALAESSAQAPTTQPAAGGSLDDVIRAGLRILDSAARE